MGIQLGQVVDLGHGRGPVALQVADPAFHVRLLLRPSHHAETRLESVVTDQGLKTVVELTLPANEQVRHDGLGVVPPQLARHATEERERFDQAVQDGLGAFGRQCDGEGTVGIGPGRQQHGHLPATIRKIYVDVAEVTLQALTRIVIERDERLTLGAPFAKEVLPDALIAAGVSVLVAQAPEYLGNRVPLFARRFLVGVYDGVDDGFEAIDDRRHHSALVLLGLRLTEDLPNLAP